MTTETKVAHVHNPTSPCSCTVQHSGLVESITYCPTHAAALEMAEFIRKASKLPVGEEWPYEPAMVTAAHALLRRLEAMTKVEPRKALLDNAKAPREPVFISRRASQHDR